MSSALFKIFARSSTATLLSAGVSLVTTLFTIRFLGPEVYTGQIVDLAKLGLLFLVMELLPSSFAILRLQDDQRWQTILAVQQLFSGCVIIFLVKLLDAAVGLFSINSWLIVLYTLGTIAQRYNDTTLQAKGRVYILFWLDLAASILRLGLLIGFYFLGVDPYTSVWLSLGLGSVVTYGAGVFSLSRGVAPLAGFSPDLWDDLRSSFRLIASYYPAQALKRLADSLVPLVAERLLPHTSTLAAFMLAFRSLTFCNTFIRIFETMLSHRNTLELLDKRVVRYGAIIAAGNHLSAFILAAITIRLSGLPFDNGFAWFLLTGAAWPISAMTILRAKNYASYRVWPVAMGYSAYIAVLSASVFALGRSGAGTALTLSAAILLAQTASWLLNREGTAGVLDIRLYFGSRRQQRSGRAPSAIEQTDIPDGKVADK